MASKRFTRLFEEMANKVANSSIKDNVNDYSIIKHYYESFSHPTSPYIPIVKNKSCEKIFLDKLEELHNLRMNFYKEVHESSSWEKHDFEIYILAYTFFRATIEDYDNPVTFLNREINFLKNDFVKKFHREPYRYIGEFPINKTKNATIKIQVEKNLVGYEANNCMKVYLMSDDFNLYKLPDIHFDLDGTTAYIKGIQKDIYAENDTSSWSKVVGRSMYKVNKGNTNKEEAIPPAHLLALTIGISYFQSIGYNKFSFPTHHPVRNIYYSAYYSNEVHKKLKPFLKDGLLNKKDLKNALSESAQHVIDINQSITDRYLNMVNKYVDCFSGTDILDYGDDLGYFTIDISNQKEYDCDHILHSIHNGMYRNLQNKR